MEHNFIKKDNSESLIMNSHPRYQMNSVSSSGKFYILGQKAKKSDKTEIPISTIQHFLFFVYLGDEVSKLQKRLSLLR